jgi:hypothetical protein
VTSAGSQWLAAGLIGVALALIAAATAVESMVITSPPPPEPVAQEEARAGAWYCPATAEDEETAFVSIAATGDEDSLVTVYRYPAHGTPGADPTVTVPAGEQHEIRLDPGHATFPIAVRWQGGPAAAAWRVEGADAAAAPCAPGAADLWHIPGFDTAAGARSFLHLFNPFAIDATVRVTFGTPEGRVSLALTDNVVVPAGRSVRVDLNEFQPEQPDLAASVEVLAGRVASSGEVRYSPLRDEVGPQGRVLLPADEAGKLEAAFGYARADELGASWLSVFNPGSREAAVELRVTDPAPEAIALGETSVPAGGVVRIDLTEVTDEPEFGLALLVNNDVPVVAARTTWVSTGDGREGVAASLGASPAQRWVLAGGGLGERRGQVAVYNPGPEAAGVDVDAGVGTPAEWSGLALGPNERLGLSLTELTEDRPSVAVAVSATTPVVAELRAHAMGERLRFWSAVGLPEAAWRGLPARPPLLREAGLTTRPWPGAPDELLEPGD